MSSPHGAPSRAAEVAQLGGLNTADPGNGLVIPIAILGGTCILTVAGAGETRKIDTPANAGFYFFVSNQGGSGDDVTLLSEASATVANISDNETFLCYFDGTIWVSAKLIGNAT